MTALGARGVSEATSSVFSKRGDADAVFCQLLLNYRDSFLHMLLDHILYLGTTHEDFPRPPQHYPKKPLGVTKNCLPDPFTLAVAPGVPPLAGRQAPESFLKGGGQGLPSVPSEASLGVWSVPFVGEEGTGDSALGGMRV